MNIAGVRNYEGHGSSAQKSIWHCMRMLQAFEAVPIPCTDFAETDIITGEKEFHQFMQAIYMDMYENPGKYVIPTAPYDEYVKSESANKPITKMHQTDAAECKLRNTFQQAIEFYPNYFYQLGMAADGICKETFTLMISIQKYREVLHILDRPHIYKENSQRLAALSKSGIMIIEKEETCLISCEKAPRMFLGLRILCSAPESKYKYMNYLRLDYKGYLRSMPTLEDVKPTMMKEHAAYVDTILKLFEKEKIKYKGKPLRSLTSSHGWKVEYTLNGKNVFGFFAEPDYLVLYLYFKDEKKITAMSKKLENDSELFHWFSSKFPERLCKCRNNRMVLFGNEKRRICGLSNKAEIVNPNDVDVEKSMAVIQIFRVSEQEPDQIVPTIAGVVEE